MTPQELQEIRERAERAYVHQYANDLMRIAHRDIPALLVALDTSQAELKAATDLNGKWMDQATTAKIETEKAQAELRRVREALREDWIKQDCRDELRNIVFMVCECEGEWEQGQPESHNLVNNLPCPAKED